MPKIFNIEKKSYYSFVEVIEPNNKKNYFYRTAQILLTFSSLVFGSGLETLQFYTGLRDLNGYLLGFIPLTPATTLPLAAIYALQCITLNGKYAKKGIDDILNALINESDVNEKKISLNIRLKIYLCSVLINTYAAATDTVGGAYYLDQQQWGLSREVTFILSALAALSSNGPTEILEAHRYIVDFFSNSHKILTATHKIIKKSDFYSFGSSEFKNTFNILWGKMYPYFKAELTRANSSVPKEPLALAFYCLELINNEKSSMLKHRLRVLNIKEHKIEKLILQLQRLKEESEQFVDDEEKYIKYKKKCTEIADIVFKNIIKTGGALEDMLLSYIFFVAAFPGITTPWLRMPALLLSTANGYNDWIFNGNMSNRGIDTFKDALYGQFNYKKNILYFFSVFGACMISHAEFALLKDVLENPDAEFPSPLPPVFPENLILVLASVAMLRAGFTYSFYFLQFFTAIAKGMGNMLSTCSQYFRGSSKKKSTLISTYDECNDPWNDLPENSEIYSAEDSTSIKFSIINFEDDDDDDDDDNDDDFGDDFYKNDINSSKKIPLLSQSAPSATHWPRLFKPSSLPHALLSPSFTLKSSIISPRNS